MAEPKVLAPGVPGLAIAKEEFSSAVRQHLELEVLVVPLPGVEQLSIHAEDGVRDLQVRTDDIQHVRENLPRRLREVAGNFSLLDDPVEVKAVLFE
jgi:hypothetical protein